MAISKPLVGKTNVTQRLNFSKSQLLVIAAVIGAIGVIALIMTFAFDSSNGDFEAETMTVTTP
jgi:ABC-type Fe3+-siderophore transport system permease subunit